MNLVSDIFRSGRKIGYSIHPKCMKEKKSDTIDITFTIRGDGRASSGNPLPKAKLTGGQQWTDRAQKYVAFKSHVVACLLDATRNTPPYPMIVRNIGLLGKPFTTKTYGLIEMSIAIRFVEGQHGDPENVFGAIADALFKQDKFLDGRFTARPSTNGCGEVDVAITLRSNIQS